MNDLIKNGAVIIPSNGTGFTTALFPVPALAPEKKPAAQILSVSLLISESSEYTLRLAIKRDLAVKIDSLTFRFRFSHLPVYIPDTSHSYNDYRYTEADLNTSDMITFNAAVPPGLIIEGCSAYISEIVLESGQRLEYDSSEYRYIRRPKNPTESAVGNSKAQAPVAAAGIPHTPAPLKKAEPPVKTPEQAKKKRIGIIAILCTLTLVLIGEAIGGVYLYKYMGVRNSTDALMKEARYNEAYKIAMDSGYESLLQRVCEKAAVYSFEKGDLETAYVYAYGAPEKFTDMIIEYAAESVVSMITGDINENAFRVAKMSENDRIFDVIVHSMIDILENRGAFAGAIMISSEIRDTEDRENTAGKVFDDAINYYSRKHRYAEAYLFINNLDSVSSLKMTKQESIYAAVKHFEKLGDYAGIIYFAHRFPDIDTSAIASMPVTSEDGGVRAELEIVYPALSEEQKRTYHAQKMAVWSDKPLEISGGKLTVGANKLSNVISVDTNETSTLVLYKNGSVSIVPNRGTKTNISIPAVSGIVDIALGGKHAVLLKSDGTVTAYGDNSHGQLNVAEWSDIAAVAAGQNFTLGLKTNGTVVATGDNSALQCEVKGCNNVVDIAAGSHTSVLLFSDGTVKLYGYRSMGLSDAETARNVTRIRAAAASILCEFDNGEYKLYDGNVSGDSGDPYNWRNMDIFDVGIMCIAGKDTSGVLFGDGDGFTG